MKRIACLLAAASLGAYACSGNVKAIPLRPAEAGAPQYRITCDKSINRCRDKAYEACAGEFQVLHSGGREVEPERISTAPGPVSTAPNFPTQTWMGELIVECGRAAHGKSAAPPTASASASAPPAPSVALPPGYLCVPGSTQLCLGAGACRGAQACLADGQGFGPCDCGPTTPSGEPRADVAAEDAGVGSTLP